MSNNDNTNTVVLGFIGHCSLDDVSRIKKQIEATPGFRVIIFRTSSEKLWIKEGERD